MASYPSTPVAFPTRIPGAQCDPAHWNLMSDEVAAWEAALMAASSQTQAPMRPRGISPAVEWGHGNAGCGNTLGTGYGTCGAVYLMCEPGTTPGTVKTRGIKGGVIAVDGVGTLMIAVVSAASADNQTPAQALTVSQAGVVGLPSQPRMLLQKNDAQAMPLGAWTDLTWDVELSDPQGFHAGTAAAITIPAGLTGTYLVTVRFGVQANAAYQGVGFNRVSGAAPTGRLVTAFQPAATGWPGVPTTHLDTVQVLTAGDVYTIQGYQNDAANDAVLNGTMVEFVRLWV